MDIAIQLREIGKRYGSVEAVKGISLSVFRGEIFGLLGPNGAGKTTTIEMIEGLRAPDRGAVKVCGHDVNGSAKAIRDRIGVQLQTTAIYPRMKVREAVSFFGGFYRRRIPIAKLLAMVGLQGEENKGYKTLSGGQKQRLALALAIVHDPEVVFLDEATAGMDPQGRRSVWRILEQLKRQGKTIFLTTHYMEEAERICDRVGIMDQGNLVALGSPSEIIEAAGLSERLVFESDREDLSDAFAEVSGVSRVIAEDSQMTVFVKSAADVLPHFTDIARTRNAELCNLTSGRANLEDAFLVLTGRRLA